MDSPVAIFVVVFLQLRVHPPPRLAHHSVKHKKKSSGKTVLLAVMNVRKTLKLNFKHTLFAFFSNVTI